MIIFKYLISLSDKVYVAIFFVIYLFMAHVVLPEFYDGKDLFVISSWDLFSFDSDVYVTDIAWNNRKSFLRRDKMNTINRYGLNPHVLSKKIERKQLNLKDIEGVKRMCECEDLELLTMKGQLYQHIIMKRELPIIEERKLK